MKKTLLTLALAATSLVGAQAQISLTTYNTPVGVNFSGFTAGATFAASSPTGAQLDSDTWAYNIDGSRTGTAATFGGNVTGGLGTSTGGVSTGGVYAFDVGGSVTALGVQPSGSIWTPGSITMRLQNNTGAVLEQIDVAWTVNVFNDQDRSNEFRFYYSGDNVTYTHAGGLTELVSPTTASASPAWVATNKSFSLSSLSVTDGGSYFLRWGGDDVSGSGSRDEFGLSGISVTAVPEPHEYALLVSGLLAVVIFLRRRQSQVA